MNDNNRYKNTNDICTLDFFKKDKSIKVYKNTTQEIDQISNGFQAEIVHSKIGHTKNLFL